MNILVRILSKNLLMSKNMWATILSWYSVRIADNSDKADKLPSLDSIPHYSLVKSQAMYSSMYN